jgi:hypothetical protein
VTAIPGSSLDPLAPLTDRYLRFAEDECHAYSPLYARLARGVAEHRELAEFVARMPDQQPNLLLAAVQFLTGPAGMPQNGAELEAVVQRHAAGIEQLMRSRHTQTNEIGRCALLLPCLPPGRLALIEVGASAGLCLLADRFLYDFGGARVGNPNSPAVIRCTPLSSHPIPLPVDVPNVVWRRGLDVDPIDLARPDDVRWLLACVWSDHVERRERLEAAVGLASVECPRVIRGDLVDDLPALLAQAPESTNLVVFHSAVFPYIAMRRRELFLQTIAKFSERREIVLVSIESPQAIPPLDAVVPERERQFGIWRTVFRGGKGHTERVGFSHPHGWELEWLGAPEPAIHQPGPSN